MTLAESSFQRINGYPKNVLSLPYSAGDCRLRNLSLLNLLSLQPADFATVFGYDEALSSGHQSNQSAYSPACLTKGDCGSHGWCVSHGVAHLFTSWCLG